MAALTCPVCGTRAEAGDLICLECGSNLTRPSAGSATAPAPAKATPAAETTPRCPHCDAHIADGGNLVCIECLLPLQAQPAGLRLVFASWEVEIRPGRAILLGRELASPAATDLACHDNVSRRHATVTVTESGHADVLDEGSTNGTFVNGERLIPGRHTPLRDGDTLRLASDVTAKVTRTPTAQID